MLTPYLQKLVQYENLNALECADVLNHMLKQNNVEQTAAALALMRARGETAGEIAGFARAMRQHQHSVDTHAPVLDIVGTGGDGANTANISTAACLLAASCGVPVLKHGSRAVTSQTGSADVIEALGIPMEELPGKVGQLLEKKSFAFCLAQYFHPALLSLRPLRKNLKIPTLFNIVGPLLNPGQAAHMILGVYDPGLMPLIADTLVELNIEHALVVHGNGLDELNCLGPCQVIEIHRGTQQYYLLDPVSLGLPYCQLSDLVGGNAKHNADLIEQVLTGREGHLSNTIILNAAAGVYVYGKVQTLAQGISLVHENILNGRAMQLLKSLRSSHA